MKKCMVKIITASLCCLSAAFLSCSTPEYSSESTYVSGENISVAFKDYSSYKVTAADVSDSFMKGVDASEVRALEELGCKFYDEDNSEKDVFKIFKAHGVNYVRLRIWNDYEKALSDSWGPYGYNDMSRTIDMARRTVKNGMKVFLDLHYSDSWADPSKQYIPEEWKSYVEKDGEPLSAEDIDIDGLCLQVSSYTKSVLNQMINAGCAPSMVQLGNEMQGGIFQRTRTNASNADGKDGNTTNLTYSQRVEVLKSAAQAIRETLSDCEIMLHMSNGGNSRYLNTLLSYAGDIGSDSEGKSLITALGFSYYPFYDSHGTDSALKANLTKAKASGYKCVIAESSYAYSDDAYTDSTNNECYQAGSQVYKSLTGYDKAGKGSSSIDASIEAQGGVAQYLMELTSSVDSEGGYFYWGASYLGVDPGMKSSWENQALFDTDGKVLPSIDVFKSE